MSTAIQRMPAAERGPSRPAAAWQGRAAHPQDARSQIGDRERAQRRRLVHRIVGVLVFVIGLAVTHVWTRVAVLGLRYELTAIERRVEQLSKQIDQGEGEVAARQSIERLMSVAGERLGLTAPRPEQIVFVQAPAEDR